MEVDHEGFGAVYSRYCVVCGDILGRSERSVERAR